MSGFERRTRLQTKSRKPPESKKTGSSRTRSVSDSDLHPRMRFPNRSTNLFRCSQSGQQKNVTRAHLLPTNRQTNQMILQLPENRNLPATTHRLLLQKPYSQEAG